MVPPDSSSIRLGLPKGRMQEGVFRLLSDAGISVRLTSGGDRGYRPVISLPGFEAKILKPQNIIEMLHAGSRDLGFAGADWVSELKADVVELLDTGLDRVRLVAAAPAAILVNGALPARPLVIASEYERLTREWIASRKLDASYVKSFGATEVFPPEDADCIVDIAATGETLRANGLAIVDDLALSSTRFYAHPRVLDDRRKRDAVDRLVLLLRSVLDARRRVMLELNVPADKLEAVIAALPAMRMPTVSRLHGDGATAGYAVKAAVPREELPRLIPEIKARGGTDLVVTALSQIVS